MRMVLALVLVLMLGTAFAAEPKTIKSATEKKVVEPLVTASEEWKNRMFTLDELKRYNGENGQPVYVVVDGIVYDLSKVGAWKTGKHMKIHQAGTDLTEAIKNKAPKHIHQAGKILDKFPKVGVLKNAPAEVVTSSNADAVTKSVVTEYISVPTSELGKPAVCPVTGNKFKVSAQTPVIRYKDKNYYFCCPGCDDEFKKSPEKYLNKPVKKKK